MKNIISILLISFYFVSYSQEFGVNQAKREISIYQSDIVYLKGKSLTKFGFNPNIGNSVYETVWHQGGDEFYVESNSIEKVSSSDAGDTQEISIEGHVIDSDGVITFVVQSATLNGQSTVTLSTPLYRVTRVINAGSTVFSGVIYVYGGGSVTAGVPQVADSIHITVPIEHNRSQKAATSLSSEDYWIITSLAGSVGISSGNNRLVDLWLEVREYGGVFQRVFPFSAANTSGENILELTVPIIVKPRSDVRVVAISSGNGTQVKATVSGFLMKKSD